MSTNSIDPPSQVQLVTLVTFRWGEAFGTVVRYCTDTVPIVLGDDTFVPEPSIEIDMGQQQGGMKDVPIKLGMVIRPPFDTLTTQAAHSPVEITIEEINPADVTSRRKIFTGSASMSTANPGEKTGLVSEQISGRKHSLEVVATSWLATTTCNSVFGDKMCGIDLEPLKETAVIATIGGNIITVTGLTTVASDGYWRFGSVYYDGLAILISDYTTGTSITLFKTPPPSWLGKTVKVTPGCDLRAETCDGKWSNIQFFTGFGRRIPSFNPYLEST